MGQQDWRIGGCFGVSGRREILVFPANNSNFGRPGRQFQRLSVAAHTLPFLHAVAHHLTQSSQGLLLVHRLRHVDVAGHSSLAALTRLALRSAAAAVRSHHLLGAHLSLLHLNQLLVEQPVLLLHLQVGHRQLLSLGLDLLELAGRLRLALAELDQLLGHLGDGRVLRGDLRLWHIQILLALTLAGRVQQVSPGILLDVVRLRANYVLEYLDPVPQLTVLILQHEVLRVALLPDVLQALNVVAEDLVRLM